MDMVTSLPAARISVCRTQHVGCVPSGRQRNYLYKTGRKGMFYLTTHSTHFIYGYIASGVQNRLTGVNYSKKK